MLIESINQFVEDGIANSLSRISIPISVLQEWANEIALFEERVEELDDRLVNVAFLEVVAYAAKHYVASGYEKPCEPWRQPLIDALTALSDNYKSSLC